VTLGDSCLQPGALPPFAHDLRAHVVIFDARPDEGRQRLDRKVTEDARLLYCFLVESVLSDRA
jgi:hypothetical protein